MPQGIMPAYEFLERTERLLENPEQLFSSLKKLLQEVKDRLDINGTCYLDESQEDVEKLKEAFIDQKDELLYLSRQNLELEEKIEVLKKSNLELSKKLETKEKVDNRIRKEILSVVNEIKIQFTHEPIGTSGFVLG